KDLDGIETELRRFGATGGQAVGKHKRPAAHFRDECNSDGGAHLSRMLTSETAVRPNEDERPGVIQSRRQERDSVSRSRSSAYRQAPALEKPLRVTDVGHRSYGRG